LHFSEAQKFQKLSGIALFRVNYGRMAAKGDETKELIQEMEPQVFFGSENERVVVNWLQNRVAVCQCRTPRERKKPTVSGLARRGPDAIH
jgi:hypothetical protein